MANIVSIEWSVEDFRRLISEPSQLSEAELPIAKKIDVVSIEIAASSKARENSLALAQAVAGPPEKIDLTGLNVVDDVATAEPSETTTPEVNGNQATFDTALEIVNFEIFDRRRLGSKSSDESAHSSGVVATPAFGIDKSIASDEHLEAAIPEATEQSAAPKALEAAEVPAMDPAVPSTFAALRKAKPKSPSLQKAIVEPDTQVRRATRDTTNGRYRGVEYSMVKGALRDVWRWNVRVGHPEMLRMGEALTAQQAELSVRSVIDRAIAVEETLRRIKRSDRADQGV